MIMITMSLILQRRKRLRLVPQRSADSGENAGNVTGSIPCADHTRNYQYIGTNANNLMAQENGEDVAGNLADAWRYQSEVFDNLLRKYAHHFRQSA